MVNDQVSRTIIKFNKIKSLLYDVDNITLWNVCRNRVIEYFFNPKKEICKEIKNAITYKLVNNQKNNNFYLIKEYLKEKIIKYVHKIT